MKHFLNNYCSKSEDKRKYRMNNQTTGFFIVVCLFVDQFRSTKTFFKTNYCSSNLAWLFKTNDAVS